MKEASGLEPTVVTYTPHNANGKNELGKHRSGASATLYDPKYTNPKDRNAMEQRAFRIYIESKLLKETTWSVFPLFWISSTDITHGSRSILIQRSRLRTDTTSRIRSLVIRARRLCTRHVIIVSWLLSFSWDSLSIRKLTV